MATTFAVATMGLSVPAYASATLAQQNGPDLTTAIHASTTNTQNDQTQVFGCTQNDGQCANTQFTGLQADATTGTAIHITDGAGFASITDANFDSKVASTQDLFNLIMDPAPDFTAYEFTIQLANAGDVSIYYMLSGGSSWILASGSPISQAANAATQYILSGDTFSAIMISSTGAIFQVKQNSINLASVTTGVPEPGTWALMLLGFGGMGMALRRSRRRGKQALMQIA
jgi:hypothetical protein